MIKNKLSEEEKEFLKIFRPGLLAQEFFGVADMNSRQKLRKRIYGKASIKSGEKFGFEKEKIEAWFTDILGRMKTVLQEEDLQKLANLLDIMDQKALCLKLYGTDKTNELMKLNDRRKKLNFTVPEKTILLQWFNSFIHKLENKMETLNRLIIVSGPDRAGRPQFYGKTALYIGQPKVIPDFHPEDQEGFYIRTAEHLDAAIEFVKFRLGKTFQDAVLIRGDFDIEQIEKIRKEVIGEFPETNIQIEVMDDMSNEFFDAGGPAKLEDLRPDFHAQMSRAENLKKELTGSEYVWNCNSEKTAKA